VDEPIRLIRSSHYSTQLEFDQFILVAHRVEYTRKLSLKWACLGMVSLFQNLILSLMVSTHSFKRITLVNDEKNN
jgi:hypothetical protein